MSDIFRPDGVFFMGLYGLLSLLAGLMFADFLTGVVHWIEDRYGNPDWPVLGPAMEANQRHHIRPFDFLHSPFLVRNWAPLSGAVFALLIVMRFDALSPFWLSAIFFGAVSNECHAANHKNPAPAWHRLGQKIKVFQERSHHTLHHRRPHTSHYCVITPWLNPFLDAGGFWKMAESVLKKLGIPPRNTSFPLDQMSSRKGDPHV